MNSWLTLFVPDTLFIMTKGLVLVPSKLRPGLVDQHDIAQLILQEVRIHAYQGRPQCDACTNAC
jgi:hypothetical protein